MERPQTRRRAKGLFCRPLHLSKRNVYGSVQEVGQKSGNYTAPGCISAEPPAAGDDLIPDPGGPIPRLLWEVKRTPWLP